MAWRLRYNLNWRYKTDKILNKNKIWNKWDKKQNWDVIKDKAKVDIDKTKDKAKIQADKTENKAKINYI